MSPCPQGGAGTRRRVARVCVVTAVAVVLVAVSVVPAVAAGPVVLAAPSSLDEVITNLTTWVSGLLAGVATLFLLFSGILRMTAGGDPGQIAQAKDASRNAAYGYGLALIAPILVAAVWTAING